MGDFPYPASKVWAFLKPWEAPYIGANTDFRITGTEGTGLGSKRFISNPDGTFKFFETLEEYDESAMVVAYRFHEAGPFVGGARFIVEPTSESTSVVIWTGNPDAGSHVPDMTAG